MATVTLPVEIPDTYVQRQFVAKNLAAFGLSQTEIATVLGTSRSTVRRDLGVLVDR